VDPHHIEADPDAVPYLSCYIDADPFARILDILACYFAN
jgi:hypothetical protein